MDKLAGESDRLISLHSNHEGQRGHIYVVNMLRMQVLTNHKTHVQRTIIDKYHHHQTLDIYQVFRCPKKTLRKQLILM